ncbi:mitochondrial import inner membrane translocase subunit Tim54 [Syncephalastrum racemosum]|uniref:Mitochondrial import inner membrane translocase subunit TIM54 n=1 Tax=Syncephalastrum racemosum TaxID=13706 RepID=A0A1X2HGU5_SYNRA|nr:mitochondrial import inner membrane translocase subunit Tim54 [Syncephalastrum racemosum]
MSTKLPFGLKAPSKGTVIFASIASGIAGTIYASKYHVNEARKAHCDKVSFLANRPCGVHEMPRKVAVFLMAPPGDSMEKSRVWFHEYVKPILVAGAVDYELKEGRADGQIAATVREEVMKRRREAEAQQDIVGAPLEDKPANPFAPMMKDIQDKVKAQDHFDGILAIGRRAWREVLDGVDQGCHADLSVVEEVPAATPATPNVAEGTASVANENEPSATEQQNTDVPATTDETILQDAPTETTASESENKTQEDLVEPVEEESPEERAARFSPPSTLSPVMYIPHSNIIGWTNIPYRLYMWAMDYKRVDAVGKYAVAAVLNQTRPLEERDIDVGEQEKKYWLGDDAEAILASDQPITVEDRVQSVLKTYTSDDLP